jgi:hypothetical protein
MNKLTDQNLIESAVIRKEWHNNEWYYNVIDFIAELRETNLNSARNYYHVLKNRFAQNGLQFPTTQMIKILASDNKMRSSDFMTLSGILRLQRYIEHNLSKRQHRIEKRKEDEVANFHPLVIEYIEREGWSVSHHVRLSSGHIVDIVAIASEHRMYIVECKPNLSKSHLYAAIGQVLCYKAEYNFPVTPAIATFSNSLSPYSREMCKRLSITLFAIKDL